MKLLKVEVPQDIFIVGWDYKDIEEAFSITDDYATCVVKSGEKAVRIETCGFVHIVTRDELFKYKELLWDDIEDACEEAIILKDFAGEIRLQVTMESGRDVSDSIDLSKYIHYQNRGGENEEDDYVEGITVVVEPAHKMYFGTMQQTYDYAEKGPNSEL